MYELVDQLDLDREEIRLIEFLAGRVVVPITSPRSP